MRYPSMDYPDSRRRNSSKFVPRTLLILPLAHSYIVIVEWLLKLLSVAMFAEAPASRLCFCRFLLCRLGRSCYTTRFNL